MAAVNIEADIQCYPCSPELAAALKTFKKFPTAHTQLSVTHASCNDGFFCITLKKKEWAKENKEVVLRDVRTTVHPVTKAEDGTIKVNEEEIKKWIGKVNVIYSGHGDKTPFIELSEYIRKFTQETLAIEWMDIGPKEKDGEYVDFFDWASASDHHPGSEKLTREIMAKFPEEKKALNLCSRGCGAMLTFYQVSYSLKRSWLLHLVNWMDIWVEEEYLWTPSVKDAIMEDCFAASPNLETWVGAETEDLKFKKLLQVLSVIRNALWNQDEADALLTALDGDDLGKTLDTWLEKYSTLTPIAEKFVSQNVVEVINLEEFSLHYSETDLKKDEKVTGGDYFFQIECNKKAKRTADGTLKPQVLVTADRLPSGQYRQIGVRKIPNSDDNDMDCCQFAKFVAAAQPQVFASAGGLPVASAMQAKEDATMTNIRNAVVQGALKFFKVA